jgi:hypothetical protein
MRFACRQSGSLPQFENLRTLRTLGGKRVRIMGVSQFRRCESNKRRKKISVEFRAMRPAAGIP